MDLLELEEVNKNHLSVVACSEHKYNMSTHCAVNKYNNGEYRLIKWRDVLCDVHGIKHAICSCEEPFKYVLF